MNNEKQHSEYKIIETVATPTFDGVSVETHPEDQLEGGGDTPEETSVKVAAESSGQYWIGKYEKLPGSSPIVLMGCDMNTSNLTLVDSTGTVLASGANPINLVEERIKSQMAEAGKSVEEVQVWHIEVTSGSQIENWDTYQEIPAI